MRRLLGSLDRKDRMTAGFGTTQGIKSTKYWAPGEFSVFWVVDNAVPDSVITKQINIFIAGPGVISVIGTTTYSTDGVNFTADPGTITTGKLWVRDTAGAYDAVVNGGVMIDSTVCSMTITSRVDPATLFTGLDTDLAPLDTDFAPVEI